VEGEPRAEGIFGEGDGAGESGERLNWPVPEGLGEPAFPSVAAA
jgi:hypothetical protein